MNNTIDPIIYLRDHIQKNKKIKKEGNNLIFEDGGKLSIHTPTAFIQSQSQPIKQYTLGSLWFYLKSINTPVSIYLKESHQEDIESVAKIDKSKIEDYFLHNIDNVDNIKSDLRPKTLIFLGKKKKGISLDELSDEKLINFNSNNNKAKTHKPIKKNYDEKKEPKMAVVDYLYTNEKKSLNRNSILKPIENKKSYEELFSFCNNIFVKKGKNNKEIETKSFLDELTKNDDLKGNKAIIVVPSIYSEGNLCMENAVEFLNNGKYIPGNNINKNIDNIFVKKILGKEISFEICSNVRTFTKNEWKKVVAVFVQGDDWEFKDWPKGENVSSILQKIKGFYLKYEDMPINKNVKKWDVHIFSIYRDMRHYDIFKHNEFWDIMTDFLSKPRKR